MVREVMVPMVDAAALDNYLPAPPGNRQFWF